MTEQRNTTAAQRLAEQLTGDPDAPGIVSLEREDGALEVMLGEDGGTVHFSAAFRRMVGDLH
jgi:hypothetical protein